MEPIEIFIGCSVNVTHELFFIFLRLHFRFRSHYIQFSILLLRNKQCFTLRSSWMFILCLLTAVIWGTTNWLLKRGSTGLRHIQHSGRVRQFFAELIYFFTNMQVDISRRRNDFEKFSSIGSLFSYN